MSCIIVHLSHVTIFIRQRLPVTSTEPATTAQPSTTSPTETATIATNQAASFMSETLIDESTTKDSGVTTTLPFINEFQFTTSTTDGDRVNPWTPMFKSMTQRLFWNMKAIWNGVSAAKRWFLLKSTIHWRRMLAGTRMEVAFDWCQQCRHWPLDVAVLCRAVAWMELVFRFIKW